MSSKQLGRIFAELDEAISERVSEFTLELHGELVSNPPSGTPISTAWASTNWWPAVGQAPTANGGPVGEPSSRAGGQSAGVAEVASYKIASGQPLWVSNNVPYISRLNAGWSQQAPAGFVEQAIETTLSKFRNKPL
jgi:hypothetical protein